MAVNSGLLFLFTCTNGFCFLSSSLTFLFRLERERTHFCSLNSCPVRIKRGKRVEIPAHTSGRLRRTCLRVRSAEVVEKGLI